jgi:hypothetical protein
LAVGGRRFTGGDEESGRGREELEVVAPSSDQREHTEAKEGERKREGRERGRGTTSASRSRPGELGEGEWEQMK